MIKSTPHAHTTFVDGRSTPEEMVLAALERGFSSLGFSEHAKQRIDPKYGLSPMDEILYIEEIERLKEAYRDRIKIHLGIERDLYSIAIRMNYDYVLASSHYFTRGDEWCAVDCSPGDAMENLEKWFGGNGLKMARAYYEQFAAYIEEFEPDIIGHFDLVRKNNRNNRMFDQNSPEYLRIAFEAMERMYPSCDLMEVSTGSMARGYTETPYPDLPLLSRWHEMGGRVILSSDCHDAAKIDYGYDAALDILRSVGYKSAVALGIHGELFEEYKI